MPPTTVPAGKPVATVPLVWNPVAMMPDDDLADDAPYAADEYGAQDEADAYWLEMPGCWDEVDPGELEAFASHLSAVSEGPSSTAEATPVIPHAPDPSTDAEDLLGQGFIDTRQCTLRRSEGRQRRASVFMAGTHRLGLGVGGITRVPAGPPPPHPGASLRRNEMAAAPHVGLAPALKRHGSVMMGGGSFTSALDRVNQIVGSSLGGSAADSVQRSASSASEAMGRLHTTGRLASVLRMSRPKAVTSMTHQMHKIRKQVMPTSEDFSPSAYLLRMHLNTPLTKLQQGQTRVTANIAEHQEQVKRLVKENFRSVIKTHLSIADIHKYLLKTEMANSEFRCTQGVITSIADVQQAASATYATIVQRQSLVDKSRTAISMFKRQEALLAIPFRIQEFTRLRAYDDVIREYTKAWGLIQGSDTQQRQVKPGSFFDGIMQEIDAAVRDALEQAVESLQDPRLTALEAREPAQLILHLQAQNVPCSLRVNPLLLFIGSKARHFDSRLSRLCSQHGLPPHDFVARALARNRPKKHSVSFKDSEMDDLFNAGTFSSSTLYASSVASTSAMSHDAASTTTAGMSSYHSSEAGSATAGSTLAPSTTMTPSTSQALLAELSDTGTDISEVPSDHSGVTATSVGSEAESAGAKTLAPQTAPPVVTVKTWCRLVGKVTRLLGKHVVAMGQIPTSLGPHLLARPWLSSQAQGDLQHAAADSHVAIAAMTAACKHLLQDILGKLNGAGIAEGDAQAGMAGALEVVLAAADELAAGGGPAPALDAMHDVVETAVSYLVSHICSRMGSQLGQAAQEERWERECSAEVQAEYGSISLMPGRLEGAITEAHVVEVADETEEEREIKLAAKVLRRWLPSHMPSLAALEATEGEVAVAPQWKLLVLLSNCAFVRQKLLPDLSAHFQGLLTADGMPEDDWMNLVRTCGDDVMLVEERLSQSYINSKGAIFEKAVQSYLYEDALWWTREQIPTAIRDEALELMYTLTIVQAEVAYNAPPGMLLQILKVLIKNLLLSWNSEVETVVGGASLGGLVQLSLELHFMKAALVQFVRPPADRVFTSAQAMVAGQVMRVVGAGGPHAARVQEVLGAVRRATSVTAWLDSASERLVAPALQAARLNLNFFMQARTGATSRATPLSKLDNAKRLIKVQGGAEETAAGIPRRLTAKFRMGSAGSITGRRKSLLIAGGLSGLPFNTSFASSSHFSPHSIGAVSQSEAAALWAQRIPQQHAGFSSRGR
ncbi:hypothetical protein WJX72_005935 [[Myrmecia] bisecta]|uniref:Exocyst complex component EXOC2/Sec5 N-terminal domain-containing protein n=1 Tax=[Myrmecia] bisecta TaxID=41462 RepID=A0AAW1PGT8_9CHLO